MFEMPAPQGWQCPVCGRVYSPTTMMCPFCGGNQQTYVSTDSTGNPPPQHPSSVTTTYSTTTIYEETEEAE